MKVIYYLLILLSLLSRSSYGQQARITVDASHVLNRIPSTLYGSCMEDVNHEVYGGIYDQRLYGESFEEPAVNAGFKGWETLKGEWRIGGGGIPSAAGRGYKLVRTMPAMKDGSMEADILFSDRGRSAGLLVRVSKERSGQDNLYGYVINVERGQKRIVLGKYQYNWKVLAEGQMGAAPTDSIHLRVVVGGTRIRVYVNGGTSPVIDYVDRHQPLSAGRVGLRCDNAAVQFRNIMVDKVSVLLEPGTAPQVSAVWDTVERNAVGEFMIDGVNAYSGRQSQVIIYRKGNGRVGIANSGLNHWGIAVRKGQRLAGAVFLRGAVNKPVIVALESADGGKVYATAQITGIGSSWKKFNFSLVAGGSDRQARFVLYIQDGRLWVDQAVLMSTGTDQFKGQPLRGDIANMMVKEGLTFLRYGGTMVNAPAYRWKNMTGGGDTRPPYKGHWYPYSTNGFGIEEFVGFCEAAGFEPAFAINVEETPEDVAGMVEHMKGRLRYIEIGNEEVIWGDKREDYEHYAERFNILYQAIHAKDPAIRVVCSAWWRPASENMELVFRAINGKAAYWDLHTDADDVAAGKTVDRNIQRMQDLFQQWDPRTTLKCAVFEENGGLHNMQRALGHATTLNAIRRHGDFVLTSCPANALQPYRQNDNDWDQGQIFFTPSQVWGMPPFYAQQMASATHEPLRVSDQTEGDLDVTATRSEDGAVLVVHVVNTTGNAIGAAVRLDNFPGRKPDVGVSTLMGALEDENTPEQPEKIKTVTRWMSLPGETVHYSFPARSYTILQFRNQLR